MLRQATQNLISRSPRFAMRTNCKVRVIPYRTKKEYRSLCKTEWLYQPALVHRQRLFQHELPAPRFSSHACNIEAGKVGTVIMKDMSRLGRNYLQVGFYTEMLFPQKGVRLIAVNDNVDSANGGMDNDLPLCEIS